jgi:VIT1/CCC1 family predicted Fe2+/Mn2+ transporter
MQSERILERASEGHKQGTWLRDVILGGQDGLVNVLGIVLGLTAANAKTPLLIAAGLAATFAESVSMGAVAYTSSLAQRDHYQSELARERREMQEIPEEERNEIREIYAAKGFHGELLERIVETITSNDETWLDVMMSEELGLQPVDTSAVLRTSAIVTVAAIAGSLIPLFPYFFASRGLAITLAVVLSALALFGVGAFKARTLVGDWKRSGLQMVLIGLGAAVVGFVVGLFFHTSGS